MSLNIQDQQDVKSILRYLKIHDPSNANEEFAIYKLAEMKQLAKQITQDPNLAQDTLKRLDECKHEFKGWEKEFVKSMTKAEIKELENKD